MFFSPPGCSAVPKTCYPDRIFSCSFLARVLGRVVSEHFWPKKKLERLSVTNQFVEWLTEIVTLGINLQLSKILPKLLYLWNNFYIQAWGSAVSVFCFFSVSLYICFWCCPLSHGDSNNLYRALFQREWGKKCTYIFDYKNFCSNHFCSHICQVELNQGQWWANMNWEGKKYFNWYFSKASILAEGVILHSCQLAWFSTVRQSDCALYKCLFTVFQPFFFLSCFKLSWTSGQW